MCDCGESKASRSLLDVLGFVRFFHQSGAETLETGDVSNYAGTDISTHVLSESEKERPCPFDLTALHFATGTVVS